MLEHSRFLFLISVWCLISTSSYATPLQADISDLFERCRLSIETSSPLDTTDLEAVDVLEIHERTWGAESFQRAWAMPNSEIYIVFTAWTAREQGQFIRHFLLRQTQLIAQGTHEIDRRLSSIPPTMNLAFLLSAQNPKGCTVTNNIAVTPDGSYFSAGSGEQAVRGCRTD